MKGHVDKSRGIVTLVVEALLKIKPSVLKFTQTDRTQKAKLIRFLGQFSGKRDQTWSSLF
jgi:hypothetical protein